MGGDTYGSRKASWEAEALVQVRNDGSLEEGEGGEKLLEFGCLWKVKPTDFLVNLLDSRENKRTNGECEDGQLIEDFCCKEGQKRVVAGKGSRVKKGFFS